MVIPKNDIQINTFQGSGKIMEEEVEEPENKLVGWSDVSSRHIMATALLTAQQLNLPEEDLQRTDPLTFPHGGSRRPCGTLTDTHIDKTDTDRYRKGWREMVVQFAVLSEDLSLVPKTTHNHV
ncbi:hypothetical protein STEG23_034832 [Scotinomys teguina]